MKIVHWNGAVLFEQKTSSLVELVVAATKARANLSGADLCGANLSSAVLECANLRGANLSSAVLECANLRGANLYGANLRGANLRGANLSSAVLECANLRGANLYGANLRGANLRGADLRYAVLVGAVLVGANLRGANLRGANLRGADLRGANLCGAVLVGADLCGANLSSANLSGAVLEKAILPAFQLVPDAGMFTAYKKVCGAILELKVPKSAARTSSLIGRKCRVSKARVSRGWSLDGTELATGNTFASARDERFTYTIGGIVVEPNYDPDVRVECTRGIHCFITRKEAEEYTP